MLQTQIEASVQAAVHEIICSGDYRRYQATATERLIGALSARMAASDVLLTSSGTAAVELALRAAGLADGAEVLLAAYDYPGNFWAIERAGGRPVLVDIEPNGWGIDQQQLDVMVAEGALQGCKAMIASHLHGQLQDVVQLRSWCDRHGLLLIEDACQAVGADIAGKPAGSHGHVGILSFGGGKLLSAGRGGALLTSEPMLAQKARIAAGAGSGPYTLSELQAAVILAQLPWLEAVLQACRSYFGAVDNELRRLQAADWQAPFATFLEQTSFYQAGWMFTPPAATGDPEQALDEHASRTSPQWLAQANELQRAGLPLGGGFSGFHRRSPRRCRRLGMLSQVSQTVPKTVTLHHRVALEQRLTSEQTAHLMYRLSQN